MKTAYDQWLENCTAAEGIRDRFGCDAAFDYLIGEKLMNLIDLNWNTDEYARELPRYVAVAQTVFDADKFERFLPKLESALKEEANGVDELPTDELVSAFRTLNRRLMHYEKIRALLKEAGA